MKRVEPAKLRDDVNRPEPGKIDIVWDSGEPFEIPVKAAPKLQPCTLIMYFPALFSHHPRQDAETRRRGDGRGLRF